MKHFPVSFFFFFSFFFVIFCIREAVLWRNHIFPTEGSGATPPLATHSLPAHSGCIHFIWDHCTLHCIPFLCSIFLSPHNVNFRGKILYIVYADQFYACKKCLFSFYLCCLSYCCLVCVMYAGNGTWLPVYEHTSANWGTVTRAKLSLVLLTSCRERIVSVTLSNLSGSSGCL